MLLSCAQYPRFDLEEWGQTTMFSNGLIMLSNQLGYLESGCFAPYITPVYFSVDSESGGQKGEGYV